MWREWLNSITKNCQFYELASSENITNVESILSTKFPYDLKNVLSETNGIYLTDTKLYVIWTVEEIKTQNLHCRQADTFLKNYAPLDDLLFFASAGTDGILFGFPIVEGIAQNDKICAWYPMEDQRDANIAHSLQDYLKRWISGDLKV